MLHPRLPTPDTRPTSVHSATMNFLRLPCHRQPTAPSPSRTESLHPRAPQPFLCEVAPVTVMRRMRSHAHLSADRTAHGTGPGQEACPKATAECAENTCVGVPPFLAPSQPHQLPLSHIPASLFPRFMSFTFLTHLASPGASGQALDRSYPLEPGRVTSGYT